MPVRVADTIKQINDVNFPVVESNDIKGGLYHVNTSAEMNALPEVRLIEGMLCYVINEDTYYKRKDNAWIIFTIGGGGGGPDSLITPEEVDSLKNIFNNTGPDLNSDFKDEGVDG